MIQPEEKTLEQRRSEAIATGACFSKSRLREEFRMKPKPEARPVKYYRSDYGKKFGVYPLVDCVPMRAASRKPPSQKQKDGVRLLALRTKLTSFRAYINGWL